MPGRTRSLSLQQLRKLSYARQFPAVRVARDVVRTEDVARALDLVGPMQTQTARSTYLGLAARFPGLTHDAITAAYEEHAIVRGTTIRGTVHTSTASDHAVLDSVTRISARQQWTRLLKLRRASPEQLWDSVEEFCADDWRTVDELQQHVIGWLRRHDPESAIGLLDETVGRYLTFGHGGLLRRPGSGSWSGQGRAVYRTAATVGEVPAAWTDPDAAVDAVIERHLSAYGPATRRDIAWWSGLRLGVVDAGVARATYRLVSTPGPGPDPYLDLPDMPAPARPVAGVRLLPEFDAVLCGYHPDGRGRFVSAEINRRLWNQNNGLMLAPLLADGRIVGYWRALGSAKVRPLDVVLLEQGRPVSDDELTAPIAALETALGIRISDTTISITSDRS